jgi:DNA/RNA endonuclease G (NUC1)
VNFVISRTVLLLSSLFFLALTARAAIDVSLQMQLGNPSGATVNTNNHDHYLIQRSVEALDYSDNLGEPVWASWDLTAADVGTNARSANFFTDTNLPPNFYRVTDADYNGDSAVFMNRGHLCPSEDRTDTRADNDAVFFMSNIMPQNGTNNSGVWGTFESFCRTQTSSNEVLIICGPSGFGTSRIPSGKAVIANYTWKIAVFVPTNSGTALSRITASTRVIALKIPNAFSVTNHWQNFVTSASQIEVDTGFAFFTALPSSVAAALRAKVDGQTNPPPAIFSFSPTNGAANTSIVISGTNFSTASAVAFNGVSAGFTINSATQISATVPANASSGFISVATSSGTAVSTNIFAVNGSASVYSGILIGWDVSSLAGGNGNYGPGLLPPSTNAPGLTAFGLLRGSGIVTNNTVAAAAAWGGLNFTNGSSAQAITANKNITFGVAANAGYAVSCTAVTQFNYRRSNSGPINGVLQYQIGAGAFFDITNLNYPVVTSGGTPVGTIDLTAFPALQNVGAGTNVTFRIVNFLGTGSSGSWYVADVAGDSALDLAVAGTVSQLAAAPNAPAAMPAFTQTVFAGNQFQFTVTGTAGSNYVVQAATNLAAPNWVALATNAAPFLFVETNTGRFSQRFYRALVTP